MEAGRPTPNTPNTISFLKRNIFGWIHTKVLPRFTASKAKKYRQATQLERNVANPAPSAPMFRPQGRMKTGSSAMLSKQPLMVPMLACMAAPSERTR